MNNISFAPPVPLPRQLLSESPCVCELVFPAAKGPKLSLVLLIYFLSDQVCCLGHCVLGLFRF